MRLCHRKARRVGYVQQTNFKRTIFPDCLGAVDVKHIRMCKPDNSGYLFVNYKNFLSTVLMALVDADYCYISIDVGAYSI